LYPALQQLIEGISFRPGLEKVDIALFLTSSSSKSRSCRAAGLENMRRPWKSKTRTPSLMLSGIAEVTGCTTRI
jgi:hypothetical protein